MNHYEVLGIKKTATQNEIREAYKKLVKKYHPDLYQGDKTFAEKKTQSINAAYEVLSDPELRKKYDDEITPNINNNYYSNTNNSTSATNSQYNYNTNYQNSRYNTSTSAYSYENYKKNNYTQYSSYDDFYQRRYSNYHRSKVPNSNYTNYSSFHNKSVFESIFKTTKQQIFAVIIIFLIYFVTLFSNINNYKSSYQNTYTNNVTINQKSSTNNKNNTNTDNNNNNSNKKNSNTTDDFYTNYEDFDINDYYTDSELQSIYESYYYETFGSFDEFKDALSKYVYYYLYKNYY